MIAGYRVVEDSDALALTVLAASDRPRSTKVNLNYFHCMQSHADEHLLKVTADRLGMELEGRCSRVPVVHWRKESRRRISVACLTALTRTSAEFLQN